jgi:superfamily II DNA or RNA helicase
MTRLGLREDEIGIIEGGLQLRTTKKQPVSPWYRPLVIVVIHNIVKNPDKVPLDIRMRFGTVLIDEAHHLPAKVFSIAGNMFYGARFALTASPRRDDGMEKI